MTGWLLDTNVISELRKPNCNARVKPWADDQAPASLFLSRVTIAEIRYGIERLPASDRSRFRLQTWLTNELRPWFADRVLDVDEDVLLVWRRLVEKGRAKGHTFPQPDLLIAATAMLHGLCVVTRNDADFTRWGASAESVERVIRRRVRLIVKMKSRPWQRAPEAAGESTTARRRDANG